MIMNKMETFHNKSIINNIFPSPPKMALMDSYYLDFKNNSKITEMKEPLLIGCSLSYIVGFAIVSQDFLNSPMTITTLNFPYFTKNTLQFRINFMNDP
jgi:hypothetical protein